MLTSEEQARTNAETNGKPADDGSLPSHDGRHLLDNPPPDIDFYVPGLVAPGQIGCFGGWTGAGKTPWQAGLIGAMIEGKGTEFCGIKVARDIPPDFKFVYLTQENAYTFPNMMRKMGLGQLEIMFLHEVLSKATGWEGIIDQAHRKFDGSSRGLFFVDPIGDCSLVKNEDDNSAAAE